MSVSRQTAISTSLFLAFFVAFAQGVETVDPALAAGAAAGSVHWDHAGWGGGGWFWCAAFDPADPDALWLGGDVAGLYKSVDGGRSWTLSNRGLHNYAVYSLAIAPGDARTLYALTTDGMARSTDGGAHWTPLASSRGTSGALSAKRPATVRAIAVDPRDARVVYAGAGTGVLRKSLDGGDTWAELAYLGARPEEGPRSGAIATVHLAPANPDLVFAAHSQRGLFRSPDGGATWSRCDIPGGALSIAGGTDAAPASFMAACGTNGVWTSGDGGATWRGVSREAFPSGFSARDVGVDPRDGRTLHLVGRRGGDGFYFVSRDGGETWAETSRYERDAVANPTLPEEPAGRAKSGRLWGCSAIAISPADPDRVFIAANWNNVVSVDGGRTWRESSRGADISCIHDLRFLDGAVYAVAMDEGLFRSRDRGATWENLAPRRWAAGLSGHQWRVLPQRLADGTTRIVSTVSPWRHDREFPNGVLVFPDADRSHAFVRGEGLPGTLPRKDTVWGEGYARALAADCRDQDTLYLGIDGDDGGGVFRSTDGGLHWAPLPSQPASRRMFYGLAVDPADPRRLYWGTGGDRSGIYVSPDAGESWRKTGVSDWIYNIEPAPSGAFVLAGGKRLWRSDNRGDSWRAIGYFGGASVVGIAVDPADERRIWVSVVPWGTKAEGGGVHETRDGGATWRDITGDLPYVRPLILRYDSARRELWAAGVGVFVHLVDSSGN